MDKKNQQPCCEKFKTMIGGQALIEGIMMRGPEKDAIVVREKGELKVENAVLKRFTRRELTRRMALLFDSLTT